MSELDDLIAAHRRALAAEERKARRRVLAAWVEARRRIRADLDALLADITRAQTAGVTVSPDWLARQARYTALLDAVEGEVRKVAGAAQGATTGAQASAVRLAGPHAAALLQASGLSGFSPLTAQAVETLVALTVPGSPIRQVFARMAPGAAAQVRDIITAGVAEGRGPRVIAAQVRQETGAVASRALTVVRTETLRAYRETALEQYQAAGVRTWIWHAALDARSCASCWAMHGTEHPTADRMGTHPNCRCTLIPKVPGGPTVTPGTVLFDAAPDATKRAVLSPSKLAAYQDGALTLPDLVAVRRSAIWGTTRSERSLIAALGDNARRYYR